MGRIFPGTLLLCSLLDLSLLVKVGAAPHFAFACHAVLSGIIFLGMWRLPELRTRQGFVTFSLLAFLFCLLAPFIGFIAIGILLLVLRAPLQEKDSSGRFVIGNPMREAGFFNVPSSADCRTPILELLGKEAFDEVVAGVAYLKGSYANHSMSLLRRVRDRSNAMASLHANAALTILSDQNETILATARNHHQKVGNSLETCYLLGSAHQLQAVSGALAGEEREAPLLLAMENFIHYPDDLPSLIRRLECGIELENNEINDRVLNQLEHVPHANSIRENLRRKVFAIEGNWSALQESFTSFGDPERELPEGVRSFWEEPVEQ